MIFLCNYIFCWVVFSEGHDLKLDFPLLIAPLNKLIILVIFVTNYSYHLFHLNLVLIFLVGSAQARSRTWNSLLIYLNVWLNYWFILAKENRKMMSLCDYPNFYLSQLKMMTSFFSTIVPSFNFFGARSRRSMCYGRTVADSPKMDWRGFLKMSQKLIISNE